jgi:hypothetical protein
MNRRDFLQQWGLSSLKINFGFLEGEFAPQDPDRAAASSAPTYPPYKQNSATIPARSPRWQQLKI